MTVPPRSRARLIAAFVLVAIVAVVGVVGWRLTARRGIALAHVPARPDLVGWPGMLADRLTDAERDAGSLGSPTDGLAALSRIYHANGFFREALSCYEGLRRLEPGSAIWPHRQANILAGFGFLEEARVLEIEALANDSDYVPARLRLGDIETKLNLTDAAAATYAAALEVEPGNPYALLGVARAEIARDRWAAAVAPLQEAIRHDGYFTGGYSLLITVQEHLGNDAAADALRAKTAGREFVDFDDPWILALNDECLDDYRLSVAAAVAIASGHPERGRDYLERAIALDPRDSGYRRQLGRLLTQMRDYREARRHLEAGVEAVPTDSDAWLLLLEVHKAMQDEAGVAQVLAQGLANCPGSPSLHLEQARRLLASGRREQALAHFQESYRLRPSEAGPLVEMASVFFALNRPQDGLAALDEALVKQPGLPMALATHAYYAISNGDQPGADRWWSKVTMQSGMPAELRERLRAAYRQKFGRDP